MLRPFIIIGVGGSGGKTLRALRFQLQQMLDARGWNGAFPDAWQFLHIDTPVVQDGQEFPAPALPISNYFGLATLASTYTNVSDFIERKVADGNRPAIMRQIPSISSAGGVPINKGAGQYRGIGRAVALAKLGEIGKAVRTARERLKTHGEIQIPQLSELFNSSKDGGSSYDPVAIFVSSMAGGSGAGQFTEVIEAAKAAVNENFMKDCYGIYFAPDVFKDVPMTSGVPANSLATISEIVNGYWNQDPSPSVLDLYNKSGLQVTVDDSSRIGAKFPMIAGAANASTVFQGQKDVYLAIATTLAGWMTDGDFSHNLSQYVDGNFQAASNRMTVPMNTSIVSDDKNPPVFNAIGFGRLTLGNEKFAEYSAERFAKSLIDIFLEAHIPDATEGPKKSSEFYAKQQVANIGDAFIKELRLSEETAENNQIVDALFDAESRAERIKKATRDIFTAAGATGPKTGQALPAPEWQRLIMVQYKKTETAVAQDDRAECQSILEKWIPEIQKHIVDVTIKYMSTYGIPVTALLLRDVKRSLDVAAKEMKSESADRAAGVANIERGLAGKFSADPQASSGIRPGSTVFDGAERVVSVTLNWLCEKNQRDVLEGLIAELSKDFVDRLAQQVEALQETVRTLSLAPKKSDGWRDNDVQLWPGINDSKVLPKYLPASNERLITPLDDFPRQFQELVMLTAESDSYTVAMTKALGEMVTDIRLTRSTSAEPIGVLTIKDPWRPRNQFLEGVSSSGKPPIFDGIADPDDYVLIAKKWMRRQGKPFGSFLNRTLGDYLDPQLPMNVLQERQTNFIGEIVEAFKASLPLVKVDNNLSNAIHGKNATDDIQVMASAIPFDKTHPSYPPIVEALTNQHGLSITLTAQNAKSASQTVKDMFKAKAGVDKIDFFALSGYVMLPIVMDSIMEPVWTTWNTISEDKDKRAAFWLNKRSRLLPEAIPLDRKAFQALIRGWYIADALSRLSFDDSDKQRGLKVSVTDASGRVLQFPHPLLHIGTVKPIDHLAAVVQSSILAMAQCNQTKNLEPLAPYEELIQLGSEVREMNSDLAKVIIPDSASDETKAQNIAQMLDYIEKSKSAFTEEMDDLVAKTTSPYALPLVWEMYRDVVIQLDALSVDVQSYRAAKHTVVDKPSFGQ